MQAPGAEHRRRLEANLEALQQRIERAASASGRTAREVRLVAVTKRVSLPWINALSDLGQVDLGENRPERLPLLAESLWHSGRPARWHMIGHYQRRKVAGTLDFCHLVHGVHDAPLLSALARRRATLLERLLQLAGASRPDATNPEGAPDRTHQAELLERCRSAGLPGSLRILLQVNVSGEASKQGPAPEEVPELLEAARHHPMLEVGGLMTMAPQGAGPVTLSRVFGGLRRLRDSLCEADRPLPELSMGMSQDFEAAISEGATLVRVGSALFQGLPADLA